MSDQDFVGRERELGLLRAALDEVSTTGRGRFVLLRGRRRVGKSRLVEQFLQLTGAPSVFFSATKGRAAAAELGELAAALGRSDLEAGPLVAGGASFATWDGALGLVAATATHPSIVVVDEFPYLVEGDASVEGAFQTAWDRSLRDRPVLLVLIGSDLAVMEALEGSGRPLYGRPTHPLRLAPLAPSEVAGLLPLAPRDALDAYLVVGGFPLLARSWGSAPDVESYLREQLTRPTSPLLVSGERALATELPQGSPSRAVLRAIGAGERTFTGIGQRSGVPRQSLERALRTLVAKSVVERAVPLSARPSAAARYRVADPALRFWLRFLERGLDEVERGRGDLLVERVLRAWPEYRGSAVEPIVREGLTRLLPHPLLGEASDVGAYWTRGSEVEVDLIGADSSVPPARVGFVGSVKWREQEPFGRRDLDALIRQRGLVPGAAPDTPLVAVSRTGVEVAGVDVTLGPAELLGAW